MNPKSASVKPVKRSISKRVGDLFPALKKIPLSLQTVHADLVQMAHGAEPGGVLYVRKQGNVEYLYGKRTLGADQVSDFLGRADSEEVQLKAERYKAAHAAARERRKIVTALKSAGLSAPLPQIGIVLEVLSDAGLFGQGVLIGTAAYQSMDALVGAFLPAAAMMTGDVDIATATIALRARADGDTMESILRRADKSFRPVPTRDRKAWPWRFKNDRNFFIDLMIPVKSRKDDSPAQLRSLGAGATRIQQLEWLLENPSRAVALHGAGVPIRVPDPARFAVHKLIVAQRRGKESAKVWKDLNQASAVLEAMVENNPTHLKAVIEDAFERGSRGWKTPVVVACRKIGFKLPDEFL